MAQDGPHVDNIQTRNLRGPLLNEYYGSTIQKADVAAIVNEIHRRWLAIVPRESGALANSGKVSFHRVKHTHDSRWEGEFSYGGPSAPHARAVEEDQHLLQRVLQDMGYYQGGGTSGPTGRVPTSQREPTVRLYHSTGRLSTAEKIVSEGFNPSYREGMEKSYTDVASRYGFFSRDPEGGSGYGQYTVQVDVPASAAERDPWSGEIRVPVEKLPPGGFSMYYEDED